MIDRSHAFPVTRQARELGISRGSVYYLPRPTSAADLAIMRRIDALHMDFPFAGSRMLRDLLAAEGIKVGRLHVSTLMKKMAIEAIRAANLPAWRSPPSCTARRSRSAWMAAAPGATMCSSNACGDQ